MPTSVETEIRRFNRDVGKFKTILFDTSNAFKNLFADETNRKLLETSIPFAVPSELSDEQRDIISKQAAFIILGQSNYAKAVTVNEVLQMNLLPIEQVQTEKRWRMIKLGNGESNMFSVHAQYDDSYVSGTSIALTDDILFNNLTDLTEEVEKNAFVIGKISGVSCLSAGLTCIVPETCRRQSVEEVTHMFNEATNGVFPILIYAFDQVDFTAWDLIELTELRRLANELPFFFVVAPSKKVYETNCLPTYKLANSNFGASKRRRRLRLPHSASCTCSSGRRAQSSAHISLPDTLESPKLNDESLHLKIVTADEQNTDIGDAKQRFDDHLASLLTQLGFLPREIKETGVSRSTVEERVHKLSIDCLTPPSTRRITIIPGDARRVSLDNDSSLFEDEIAQQTSELCVDFVIDFSRLLPSFVQKRLQAVLIQTLNKLAAIVHRSLQGLILQAYDISYELMATPKRLTFAKDEESRLYATLVSQTKAQRERIYKIIDDALRQMRIELPEQAAKELDISSILEQTTFPLSMDSSGSLGSTTQTVPSSHDGKLSELANSAEEASTSNSRTSGSMGLGASTNTVCSNRSGFFNSFRQRSQDLNKSYCSVVVKKTNLRDSGSGGSLSVPKWRLASAAVRAYVIQKLNIYIAQRVLECIQILHKSSVGTLERVVAELEVMSWNEPMFARRMASLLIDDSLSLPSAEVSTSCNFDEIGKELYSSLESFEHLDTSPGHNLETTPVSEMSRLTYFNSSVDHFPIQIPTAEAAANQMVSTVTNSENMVANSESESKLTSFGQTNSLNSLKSLLRFSYGVSPISESCMCNNFKDLLRRIKDRIGSSLFWNREQILDSDWIYRTSVEMLSGLSEARIAKDVCGQLLERLDSSHELFIQTLNRLQSRAKQRVSQFEESQKSIRRDHAPRFARHLLDITSLRNVIAYGIPLLSKEIGRGQFGVVYSCSSWGPNENLAVKSVLPHEDRHWCDVALEIFYCKQIPQHDRIVTIYGSVINYRYGQGGSPAVYVIMERLTRDLYVALRSGLDWISRLHVALDVMEGIRFLHAQGLVHRDIKPRNVLLDRFNRGKLTDMGFCKPLAMITGSILGTPMHMAPEIFDHNYCASVDIYAFGILFWYICAGRVRVPSNFEPFSDKDDLWSGVRKGLRPERLATFPTPCWDLMKYCWSSDATKRPHAGIIFDRLTKIFFNEQIRANASGLPPPRT